MKKKLMALICATSLILAMGSLSFAHGNGHRGMAAGVPSPGYGHMYNADLSEEELEKLHDERMDLMKENIAKYLEDKKITQEQHDAWLEHIDAMDKFHEENGFAPGIGRGFGGCHGGLATPKTDN